MNKFIKLLTPVILSTAAVTPVVCCTSCGNREQEVIDMYSFKMDEPYEPKNITPLDPSVGPLKQSGPNSATSLYVDYMKKHPEHFKEDMLRISNGFVTNLWEHTRGSNYGSLKKCEFGFGKPKFGSTTIWEFGFDDIDVDTITFKSRVNLVFEKEDVMTGIKKTKHLTIDISYSNMVFLCYEVFGATDGDLSGWTPGIIDNTFGYEAFWVHHYNTQPWSISYSCVDENTEFIPGSEGKPSVEIKNCRYYSGLIDNADKLYNLYKYRQEAADGGSAPALEIDMIDIILLNSSLPSFYFTPSKESVVGNIPDVCIREQLNSTTTHAGQTLITIEGIHLIKDFSGGSISVKLGYEAGHNLELIDSSDPDRIMNIPYNAQLKPISSGSTDFCIDGVTLSKPYTTQSRSYHSYTINLKYLPIIITWSGQSQPIETQLYLHYNTIKLFQKE